MVQRPDATRVASYRTWKRLGRSVKRGETGIRIMVPYRTKVSSADDTSDPLYVIRGFGIGIVFDTLSRDSDGHTAARHESVRECHAASHAALVG